MNIRAIFVLGGWIIIQLISFNGTDGNNGGIAYAAHIGGFISGIVLIHFFKNKNFNKGKLSKRSLPSAK